MNFYHAGGHVNPGPLFIIYFNRLSLALISGLSLLLLCWSGGAADHSPEETPKLLSSCGSSLPAPRCEQKPLIFESSDLKEFASDSEVSSP